MSIYQINASRAGVAFFDDPNNPLAGICSLAGGESVRFRTVGDLMSDCIWITNLSYQQAYSFRLHNNPKIKLSNFFRTELVRLAQELNLDLVNQPNKAITFLSQIADRTVQIAANVYKVERFKDSLKKAIEDALLEQSEPIYAPFVSQAIDNSFKAYQNCWGARLPSNAEYFLRFQRTTYAKSLLQLPIPNGNWRRVNNKFPLKNGSIKTGTESRIFKFLEELTACRPALLKVSVSDVNPAVAHLLDYGQGTEQREWVPVQEIAQIAAYADVTILDMLVCDSLIQLDSALVNHMKTLDSAQEAGFSYGLVAENHLHALFSKRKQLINGSNQTLASARSSWLRAWDRVICFAVAAELEQQGFRVLSYGIGNIQVSCPESKLSDLAQAASMHRLTAPMAMMAHINSIDDYADLLEDKPLYNEA